MGVILLGFFFLIWQKKVLLLNAEPGFVSALLKSNKQKQTKFQLNLK